MYRKRINKVGYNTAQAPIYSSIYGKSLNNNQNKNKQQHKRYHYTQGDLGFDQEKANYIAHLIKRFNEYKKKEIGKENINYQVFESTLKKYFFINDKNKTIYHLPISKFEELAEYIQKRINATKFAVTLGRNHKNFSSFEEYTARQS